MRWRSTRSRRPMWPPRAWCSKPTRTRSRGSGRCAGSEAVARAMLAFTLKRLGLAILVALAVSALAFLLLRASGDVAIALAGEGARAEDIENIRHVYGLDRPLLVQYFDWLWKMAHGDFGQSLYFKTEVWPLVMEKLPTTMLLAMFSLAFALAVSIPLSILGAVSPNT